MWCQGTIPTFEEMDLLVGVGASNFFGEDDIVDRIAMRCKLICFIQDVVDNRLNGK